jgi:nitroreductase
MNSAIENLLTRRSIRKYTDEKVRKEDLDTILEAGKYAPSGSGKQPVIMLVVQDEETLELLRRLNCTSVGNEYTRDNFYGAKTVIVVLADRSSRTYLYDGALTMGNLMNAAAAIGVGSCWIHRARETFETDEGKALLKKLGIEGDYEGIGNCILGYPAETPVPKPRKENFVYYSK